MSAEYQNSDAELGKVILPTLWTSPSHSQYWSKTKLGMVRAILRSISKIPISETIRVLDVGCSSGTDIFMYSRMLPQNRSIEYVGVDVSEVRVADAISSAESLGLKNTSFQVGDALKLDNVKGEFDIVTSSEVIEHVHDPAAMIHAMAGKLKQGGHLVLTTPTVTRTAIMFHKYIFNKIEKATGDFENKLWASVFESAAKHSQGHISEMRVERLSKILVDNNLKLLDLKRGFLTYGGYGWERHRAIFGLAYILDLSLDAYFNVASKIPFLRSRTFSVNAVYHAVKQQS